MIDKKITYKKDRNVRLSIRLKDETDAQIDYIMKIKKDLNKSQMIERLIDQEFDKIMKYKKST